MGFATGHGKHVWSTAPDSAKGLRKDKQEGESGALPIIFELVLVPSPFLEASAVDGSDTFVYTRNADFIRAQSDNVPMSFMSGMNRSVFLFAVPFP